MAPHVRELPPPDDSKHYLALVKQVLEDFKSCGDSDAKTETLQSLVFIYLSIPAKLPAKRVIASFFQNLEVESQSDVESSICEQLSCRLCIDKAVDGSLAITRHTVDSIAALMENFKLGERCLVLVALQVIKFLAEAEEHFLSQVHGDVPPVHLNELMHHCHVSVQALSLVLQKIVVGCAHLTNQIVADSQLMTFIMDLNLRILHNEIFLLDCRCCCAMNVFILLQLPLTDHEAAEKIPSIILPEKGTSSSSISWLNEAQIESLHLETMSTLSYLAAVFGYIAAVSPGSIVHKSHEGFFFYLDSLLPHLLTHGLKCTDTMSKALFGKTVHLWTSKLLNTVQATSCPATFTAKCMGQSSVLYKLLEYVWTHSDDQLDVVRQSSKSVFENILKIHSLFNLRVVSSNCLDEFTEFILTHLFSMSWTSRGKFSALTCVVRLIGAEVMIGRKPELPLEILMQLQEQALSCYASELYTALFSSHRQQLLLSSKQQEVNTCRAVLNTTWVEPVIRALCSSNRKLKQNLIEYLLCKFMKCDDQLLSFMIQRLSATSSDQAEPFHGAIIMCLRRAQVVGLLRPAPTPACDSNLWYGHLRSDVLREALCSSDEQIRLDAFALLCDNYKTTETVTGFEFSMLKFFIPSNLNNQSPSFRQSFLSLLNKLFFRLKESLAALRRRARKYKQANVLTKSVTQYENFLLWLTEHMLDNLYPGSAFARRTTSLAVVSLMSAYFVTGEDGFSLPAQLTKRHIQTLLECLADTFEENKREAVKVCTVYLTHQGCIWDTKGLEDVMSVSLSLACSTRPQDCSTAAYNLLLVLKQLEYHPTQFQLSDIIPSEVLLSTQMLMQSEKMTASLMLQNILLSLLDSQISVANQNLITAAANRPMYPTLHCIRYIMQEMAFKKISLDMASAAREFIQRLITSCLNLSRVVSPVVQNSSPEGNVPEALLGPGLNIGNILEPCQPVSDKKVDEQQTTDQSEVASFSRALVESMPEYLVVCCWRSIKEVSLTLGNMCLQIPPAQMAEVGTDSTLLSLEQVKIIGEYFTTQLLESIHRGAFELAYAGFQSMCQMLWNHPLTSFHQLPAQWLTDVIHSIKSDDPDSKLCATRRSAGVPFFVQAVTSTEPASTGRKCFHSIMKELLVLALSPPGTDGRADRLKSNQTQVHALNILRALYRDARLGDEVVPYVADGLKASILGFKSEQWAVQNSATLLLSALMTRMFGVKRSKDETNMSKKNCQTGRAFFHHYPSLYPFLLSELEEATADVGSKNRIHIRPSLYPVLLVLGRLFPSTLEGSDTSLNLSAFIPYVIRCAASPVYKTRVIASRALQPLARRNQVISICCQLLESIPEARANENDLSSQVHGLLLQLCQLAKLIRGMASGIQEDVLDSILCNLTKRVWLISSTNTCFATRQAALVLVDVVLDISVTVGHRFPEHIKAINELKRIFLTALLQVSRSSEQLWLPLYFDLEKTRARLCLKHLADVSSVTGASAAAGQNDCNTEHGEGANTSPFDLSHAADTSCLTSPFDLSHAADTSCLTSPFDLSHAADTSCLTSPFDLSHAADTSCLTSPFDLSHAADTSCLTSKIVRQDVLVKLLGSPLYEVRLEVLDVLWTFWRTNAVRNSHDANLSKLDTVDTSSGDLDTCISVVDTERFNIGLSNTALEELSPALFDHILKMALQTETHHECLQKLFCVLVTIASSASRMSEKSSREILEIFSHLQTRIKKDRRIEVKAAMLRFAGRLVPLMYGSMCSPGDGQESQELEALRCWIQLMKSCSSSDENPELQISCCQVLQENATILFCDPDRKLGSAVFLAWDSLALLLQEDDLEVKDIAASVLCLVHGLGPGSYHPSYALHCLPAVLVSLHTDRDLPGVVSCLLQWILCDNSFDIKDSSERLFDKGEMNVYRDPVAFTRSIASTLAVLFGLDLQYDVCSLGTMADVAIEAAAVTEQPQPRLISNGGQPQSRLMSDGDHPWQKLTSDGNHPQPRLTSDGDHPQPRLTSDEDQPWSRLTSDKNMAVCARDEHFSKFVLQAVSSLTNDLGLLFSSCQQTDVYMNSGRYMTLCQTVYKAKVVLLLFRKQICNHSHNFQLTFDLLESMASKVTGEFHLNNTLTNLFTNCRLTSSQTAD